MKNRVMGQVPLLLGYSIEEAEADGNRVRLHLVAKDGTKKLYDDRPHYRRDRVQARS